MEQKTFEQLRKIIYDTAGIKLADQKVALVKARVGKRLRVLGLEDENEYLKYISDGSDQEEIVELIDAISTNVTKFFREEEHFKFLKAEFSRWLSNGQRKFRIWSAGCSSGQEPYSIAMVLLDTLGSNSISQMAVDLKILATDISTDILKQAETGIYPENKMEGITPLFRNTYFEAKKINGEKHYTVKNSVKNLIKFGRLNLSVTPFQLKGPLDIIFCRNTMIYFDTTVRGHLVSEFERLLKTDGYLMVGHSESLTGFNVGFQAVRPSTYIRRAMINKVAA